MSDWVSCYRMSWLRWIDCVVVVVFRECCDGTASRIARVSVRVVSWLKEFNSFWKYDPQNTFFFFDDSKNWTSFQHDSQNWTNFFIFIWLQNWTLLLKTHRNWTLLLNMTQSINLSFWENMTQRIELYFSNKKWHKQLKLFN